ncbi:6-phosphofructo-2-kinase / fructose-2,6-bisphosphatase [Pseudohyphozyma bogoriensis]|nr:6-phosphofructo-2-kinase / fructose-2,6-bisphosphatase [Pseudohyphozyma bogoriensis]
MQPASPASPTPSAPGSTPGSPQVQPTTNPGTTVSRSGSISSISRSSSLSRAPAFRLTPKEDDVDEPEEVLSNWPPSRDSSRPGSAWNSPVLAAHDPPQPVGTWPYSTANSSQGSVDSSATHKTFNRSTSFGMSAGSTIEKPDYSEAKIVVAMVGLPARGKSYLSNKLQRYLLWLEYEVKVFNVGQYRRKKYKEMAEASGVKSDQSAAYFDQSNPKATKEREAMASDCLESLISWLKAGGNVGIHGGSHLIKREPGLKIIFIESMCTDPAMIAANIAVKVRSGDPDYDGMDPEQAERDFKERIRHYEDSYQTLDEELDKHVTYCKMVDVGKQVTVNRMDGYLQSRIAFYLMNLHLAPRSIYFTRHGESQYNVEGKIGGDALLSTQGQKYMSALPKLVKDVIGDVDLTVWTSTLKRTIQTASHLPYEKLTWKSLDELDAGVCDGMTYEEIAEQYPEDYAARDDDKYNYRYRGGESYRDVVVRLEPVILELERQQNILVVCHQAVLRCLYAYFHNLSQDELPYIKIPLHTIIKLTPRAYGCDEERFKLPIDAVDTTRPRPAGLPELLKRSERGDGVSPSTTRPSTAMGNYDNTKTVALAPRARIGTFGASIQLVTARRQPMATAQLTEPQVVAGFHSILKDSLAQARGEGLLTDEEIETGDVEVQIAGPALALFFGALGARGDPPSIDAPDGSFSLTNQNCPPSFEAFFRLWQTSVPAIKQLKSEARYDLALMLCDKEPQGSPISAALTRLSGDLKSIAIEITQRRTFQLRFGSDLKAALDSGVRPRQSGESERSPSTGFVPPPGYSEEAPKVAPGPPSQSLSSPSRQQLPQEQVPTDLLENLAVIRETLYSALADCIVTTPSIVELLSRGPTWASRAFFSSTCLHEGEVLVRAVQLGRSTPRVIGVSQTPPYLRPFLAKLGQISDVAKQMGEADDERAMREAAAGEEMSVPRLDRLRERLENGAGDRGRDASVEGDGEDDGEGELSNTRLGNEINRLALGMANLPAFRDRQVEVFKILSSVTAF